MKQYLLVRSGQNENRWGRFAAELLRAEGLMGFEVLDLDSQPLAKLGADDLLLVTRCFLRAAEMAALLEAVNQGAGVVFLMPQSSLMNQLGLTPRHRVLYPSRLRLTGANEADADAGPLHLPVPGCAPQTPEQWRVLAEAHSDNPEEPATPAVLTRRYGKGCVGLFAYDLAAEVARWRFGDPTLASLTTLGWSWTHAADMFVKQVDAETARRPHVDEHTQLLAEVLTETAPAPLARLWYYPRGEQPTAAVIQSDGDGSEPYEFEALAAAAEQRGGSVTFYLMSYTKLTPDDVAALRRRGHSFGPHVFPLTEDEELFFTFAAALDEQTQAFDARFDNHSASLQCHYAPWIGATELIAAHLRNNYRLLFAHLSLGPMAQETRQAAEKTRLWNRYMCGSARPLRFCSPRGEVLDCWQQPVTVFDDASVKVYLTEQRAQAEADFDAEFERICGQGHGPLAILSHPLSFYRYSRPVIEHIFDRLQAGGAPIFNADEWLTWNESRDGVKIRQQSSADGLEVTVSGTPERCCLMLPVGPEVGEELEATVGADSQRAQVRRRFGRRYACIDLDGARRGRDCRVRLQAPAP